MLRLLVAFVVIFDALAGQRLIEPERAAIRVDSRMVLVPVIVTDRRGATVNGLTASSFTVLEDKTPQAIVSFSEENVPCSMGIVFDLSGSMSTKMADAKRSLKHFLDLAEPEDEAFLVTVADEPGMRREFTRDFPALLNGLAAEYGRGSTALVDSVYSALHTAKKAHNKRRALLVISDGMDNNSRYSDRELMNFAVEADVEIHTIAIYDPPAFKKPIQLREETRGLLLLEELANRTGGLHFVVRGERDMQNAAATIGKALRSEYLIGYRPAAGPDGRWHRVQVKLAMPDVQAHSRGRFLAE